MVDTTNMVLALIEQAHREKASRLNLAGRNLAQLPESVCQLTQLQNLNLSGNQLTELPESIGQLTQLQSLNLNSNLLRKLPDSISKLTLLQSLYLSGNQLTELPESIGRLIRVQKLDLSANQLTGLPESIICLTQLRELNLYENSLIEFPESITRLTQLRALHIPKNRLKNLPDSIGLLTRLAHLSLSNNQLTELIEAIGRLTKLQTLSLSGNQINELPEYICSLQLLRTLDIADNQLQSLPESIGQLTNLQSLNLTNNQLQRLPDSIKQLTSLYELYLHGNDALGLPAEILGAPYSKSYYWSSKRTYPRSIVEYYFRLEFGRQPLNEAKLVLVGRGAVGKTSIVNRLVHGIFKEEKKTEGINITEWRFQLHGDEDVRLNIWDFGGQEIMHATHQFFLTQRSLYLLVLNGREGGEDADADYWLKYIESFGADSPVIIVMNKIKEHAFDVNRRALQKKYPYICGFIKTDCADPSIGINELRSAIKRETNRLAHLRDAFPASWFNIKEKLSGMKENYLSFKEYRQFCEANGEIDKNAQEALAGYLHDLGIALNFKDDPRLQDTHVLNPHWVTNGIYKILNSEKLAEQNGEIRLDDLPNILDPDEYPASMRRFLLDLMKKFELCFSFPDDDTHYLIPELLDKQEPEEATEFEPHNCLNFQYDYPVLPEGLLPRFIVRTHVLSDQLPRWRSGVILKFENNRALVKSDAQDKKVFIYIKGDTSGRRRLLAIIRSDFERIHKDFSNLQPQEMVSLPDFPGVVVPYNKLITMEREGFNEYPEVANGSVVKVDVQLLLNGVDLEGVRKRERRVEEHRRTLRLFYSYSHKDENLREELETHLKLLHREGLVDAWHDRRIEAGEEWKQKIDENLERADIVLLLVSADFIASDYCYDKEMKRALERHEHGEARVIPIILRDVSWARAPFAKLQVLPKDGVAITKWPDRDSAWKNVEDGIEKVAERMRKTFAKPLEN